MAQPVIPPTAAPTTGQPLHLQFRSQRERDWKDGRPPERPSPYWFSLATDAVWMGLQLAERALLVLERISITLDNIAIPGPKPSQPIGSALPAAPDDSDGGL